MAAVGSSDIGDALVTRPLDAFGPLDVMVTNAGLLRDKVLRNMTDEDFDAVIDVRLRGIFPCACAAVRHSRDAGQGGRLILAGSPAGQRGGFGQTDYAAAQACIAATARSWARECAEAQVTVNAPIPNAATARARSIPFLAPYVDFLDRGEPVPSVIRRTLSFGGPEDCAGLVVFLASDAAFTVIGQRIGIGGDSLALWSHPAETRSAFHDGGWEADTIVASWSSVGGERPETCAITLPELPTTDQETAR